MLDTVAGLPVHALVVHAVVVLVPLGAIGAIVMAVRPSLSKRFGIVVVLVLAVGALASWVAKSSGDELAGRVGTPELHSDLGHDMPLVATGLFVVVLAFWLFDRGIPANRSRPGWLIALAVVVVLASLFAIYLTVRVGHTGAEATWSAVIENTQPAGG